LLTIVCLFIIFPLATALSRLQITILITYLVIVRVVVFNATFNNILAISWRSVLLLEETEYLPQVTYKL